MNSDQSQTSSNQFQTDTQVNDEQYLKIWEIEQEHFRTRWTVTTFFMSVSFAIFGFSFQQNLSPSQALAARLAGLLIYWFAYIQFAHMYSYSWFLRDHLARMEMSGRTSLDIQQQLKKGAALKRPVRKWHSDRWLLVLGVIYIFGIGILWLFHL